MGASVWGGAGAPLPEPLRVAVPVPPDGRDANAIVDDLVCVQQALRAVKDQQHELGLRMQELEQRTRALRALEARAQADLQQLISFLTIPRELPDRDTDPGEPRAAAT